MTLDEAFKSLSKLNMWNGNELKPYSQIEKMANEIREEYKQRISSDEVYLKAIYLLSFRLTQIKKYYR